MTGFSALHSWSSAQSSSTLIFAAWALPRPASLLRPSLSVVFLFLRLFWPTAPLIPTSSSVPSICIILVVFVKWFSFYASLRYLDRKHYLCEALHPGILVPNAQCPLSPFRPGLSTSPHSLSSHFNEFIKAPVSSSTLSSYPLGFRPPAFPLTSVVCLFPVVSRSCITRPVNDPPV